MKTHSPLPDTHLGALNRLTWVWLLPVLALSLVAQPLMDQPQKAMMFDWPVEWPATPDDYIVVSSSTLDGPWVPWLGPVARGPGYCQMAVPTDEASRFFGLVEGHWFMDDFDDGDLDGWKIDFLNPEFGNLATVESANGQLRIHGTCPAPCDERNVFFAQTNLTVADFAMSIDILGWDERQGDVANIVLFARLDPDRYNFPEGYCYAAGLGMRDADNPDLNESIVFVGEFEGLTWHLLGDTHPIPKTDPVRDYRLVFYGVGNQLTVQAYDLTDDTTLVGEYEAPLDDTLTNGWLGFWVVEHGSSGTVDFTLDNIVVVGTLPPQ